MNRIFQDVKKIEYVRTDRFTGEQYTVLMTVPSMRDVEQLASNENAEARNMRESVKSITGVVAEVVYATMSDAIRFANIVSDELGYKIVVREKKGKYGDFRVSVPIHSSFVVYPENRPLGKGTWVGGFRIKE